MGVYSAGYLNFLGPKATLICLNIYLACTVNSQLCTTFCLIFQYSAVKPFSWLAKFGYCPKCIVRVYAAYFFAMVSFLTIFLHMSVVDQSDFANYANLTGNYYALELIQHQPSWIGFSGAIKPIVYIFAFFAIVPDFLIPILAITLTIKLYFIIKADKAHVSLITRGLEKNLYYTFVFRTLMLIFLFTIPYFCIVGTIVFGIVNSSIGIICHCIMVLQILVCLIGTLIIIKPFRIFVFQCFYDKNGDSLNSNSSSEGSLPSSVTFQSLPSLPSKKSFS
uniref:Uncharacterized protein n=1 Tax=Panagrolaimus davidi TaxID=227884 RepID=A0A914Q3C6_9BILA